MYRIDDRKLLVDANSGELVARTADSFVTALGEGRQSDLVIFRLYRNDWPTHGGLVPPDRAHQFALPAHHAAELGRQLLELAAQAEKERGRSSH